MKNRSSKYWAKRAERRMVSAEKVSDAYYKKIAKVYDNAYRETNRLIRELYRQAYRSDKTFDVIELYSIEPTGNLKRFYDEMKRLGLYSELPEQYKGRLNRLEALNAQIWAEAKTAGLGEEKYSTEAYKKVLNQTYYYAQKDIKEGSGIGFDFETLDTRTLNKILGYKFDGLSYSERIWGQTDVLAQQLSDKLAEAIATGASIERTSREFRDRFSVKQSYARRLIRTETNYFENQAEIASYKDLGVEEFVFVATLDARTSDICQEMDGERIKITNAVVGENIPPLHPNCRSTIRAYLGEDWNPERRIARNPQTDENYMVDGSMTYREWDDLRKDSGQLTKEERRKKFIKLSRDGDFKDLFPKGKPMTFEKADGYSVNPLFHERESAQGDVTRNCQSAVVAFEMRRRGYDVEVLPRKFDNEAEAKMLRLSYDSSLAWIDRKTGRHPVINTLKGRNESELYDELMSKLKSGERYTFEFSWKNSNAGHIVMIGRYKGGIQIYDPQSGRIFNSEKKTTEFSNEVKDYLSRISVRKSYSKPSYTRVDNLLINENLVKYIVKNKTEEDKKRTEKISKEREKEKETVDLDNRVWREFEEFSKNLSKQRLRVWEVERAKYNWIVERADKKEYKGLSFFSEARMEKHQRNLEFIDELEKAYYEIKAKRPYDSEKDLEKEASFRAFLEVQRKRLAKKKELTGDVEESSKKIGRYNEDGDFIASNGWSYKKSDGRVYDANGKVVRLVGLSEEDIRARKLLWEEKAIVDKPAKDALLKEIEEERKKISQKENEKEAEKIRHKVEEAMLRKKLESKKNLTDEEKEILHKLKQLDIILEKNPMIDDYHTGIRILDDIKTLAEALKQDIADDYVGGSYDDRLTKEEFEKAIKSGKIMVYSSYPIKDGTFVSTSKIMAEEYAGGSAQSGGAGVGKTHSKLIDIKDVAWIDTEQGQIANVVNHRKPLTTEEMVNKYSNYFNMPDTKKIDFTMYWRKQVESGATDLKSPYELFEEMKKNSPQTNINIINSKGWKPATKKSQSEHNKIAEELSTDKYQDGTYDLTTKKTVDYDKGYQVTFCQIGDDYSSKEYAEKVNEFLAYSSDGKVEAGKFEGTPEISFHVDSKEEAIRLAKKYNQISIWDWGEMDEIKTGGTGRR